jgi:hypothetical protein
VGFKGSTLDSNLRKNSQGNAADAITDFRNSKHH